MLGLERVAEGDLLAPRPRRCPRRGGGRRRAASSAWTCRHRSRRPARAPGRRAAPARRPRGRCGPRSDLVSPRARSTTSPWWASGAGRAAASTCGVVLTRATVACVTHFCREFGRSCLLDVTKSAVLDCAACGPATSSTSSGTGSPGPAPSSRRPAGWPAPRSPRASTRCSGSAWWCRSATPPRPAAGRRRCSRSTPRPGWWPASTSAPPTPRRRSPTSPGPSSPSGVRTSTSPRDPSACWAGSTDVSLELLEEAGRQRADLVAIGMGLPGPVEHSTGRAINPPIMPGWDRYDVPGPRAAGDRRPGPGRQRREHHGAGRAARPPAGRERPGLRQGRHRHRRRHHLGRHPAARRPGHRRRPRPRPDPARRRHLVPVRQRGLPRGDRLGCRRGDRAPRGGAGRGRRWRRGPADAQRRRAGDPGGAAGGPRPRRGARHAGQPGQPVGGRDRRIARRWPGST